MNLKDLIAKAYKESPTFKAKYDWRVLQRNKRGDEDLEWLMEKLEDALGRDFVEAAARKNLEGIREESQQSSNPKEILPGGS